MKHPFHYQHYLQNLSFFPQNLIFADGGGGAPAEGPKGDDGGGPASKEKNPKLNEGGPGEGPSEIMPVTPSNLSGANSQTKQAGTARVVQEKKRTDILANVKVEEFHIPK